MSARIKIRNAVQTDQRLLVEMIEQIGSADPVGYTPGWIGSADGLAYVRYHIEKGWVVVAEHDGKAVGHCAWSIKQGRPHQAYVRYAELETVFVSPELRNKGIAEALVKAFSTYCSQHALSVQTVHAVPDPRTLTLFERLGFVEARRFMIRGAAEGRPHR